MRIAYCNCNCQEAPVVIMPSRDTAPLRWKVECGFSRIFFRSFSEAVAFCDSRGFQMVKNQMADNEGRNMRPDYYKK